jgi:hypothetical protein
MKKAFFALVIALLAVPCIVSAQTAGEVPKEPETSQSAVPPYPRCIRGFVTFLPQYQTCPKLIEEAKGIVMKNEFSASVAFGATFQLHWEEHGGGAVPFSIGYFREYKRADKAFAADAHLAQGVQLSMETSFFEELLPALRISIIGRVGRYGYLHKEDHFAHLGKKFYHGVGTDQDKLAGFGAVEFSYAFHKAPGGKTALILQPGILFAYGTSYSGIGVCSTALSLSIAMDCPSKRLR